MGPTSNMRFMWLPEEKDMDSSLEQEGCHACVREVRGQDDNAPVCCRLEVEFNHPDDRVCASTDSVSARVGASTDSVSARVGSVLMFLSKVLAACLVNQHLVSM